tara:strand:- start:34 stop:213 length:180 start_codon:yes stop_codon:yes gene_type:complete
MKKIVKEEKIINDKNKSMYIPLEGSLANVWTEFKIPDLTKNVPVTLSVKVERQSIITQK